MAPKNAAKLMISHTVSGAIIKFEAEKMMGKKFDKMTQNERRLAATCISAFFPAICEKYGIKEAQSE